MRDIAEQLSYSREALQTLDQFAPEEPSSTGTSAWDAQRALVLAQSARVVVALGNQSYWQRLFFPELLYSKWPEPYPGRPWTPNLPPTLSDSIIAGLIFDHRLALPAYVEAITIRLTILAAVVKDHRVIARDELTDMALNLESYLTRIRAGIVYVFVPPANINEFSNNPQDFVSVPKLDSRWRSIRRGRDLLRIRPGGTVATGVPGHRLSYRRRSPMDQIPDAVGRKELGSLEASVQRNRPGRRSADHCQAQDDGGTRAGQ